MSKEDVTVAMLDDHTLVRKGLVELVNQLGGYHVVMQAANGKAFIEQLTEGPQPAIAIIDLRMPVMNGYDTIAWVRDNRPEIKPVALTFEGDEDIVLRAIHCGARAFLLKDIEPEELKVALDTIMLTGYYHTDMLQHTLVAGLDDRTIFERERKEVIKRLSDRELEFIKLVCLEEELTYEAIADRMQQKTPTIHGYRKAIFEKFSIKSKTGLVLFAIRRELR